MFLFLLFLVRELRLTDIVPPQLHIQHSLHRRQQLLVGSSGSPLVVLDDSHSGIALSRKLLLSHLMSLLVTALLDRISDSHADSLGLDDVV